MRAFLAYDRGMKIIGVGFGRTGTLSTCTALNQLGYFCYHMTEVLANKANAGHLDFWHRVAHEEKGKQHDWSEVFERYDATVDNPACCVWRELIDRYPDAKVILTLHPGGPEAWHRSTINTIYKLEKLWQVDVIAFFIPRMRKMKQMCRKLIWDRSHHNTMDDREQAIARYHEHIEEVQATVPADKLLVYSVDQGWGPLCDFLGRERPDTDFPKVNETAAFRKGLTKMTWVAYGFLVASALALAGLIYAISAIFW